MQTLFIYALDLEQQGNTLDSPLMKIRTTPVLQEPWVYNEEQSKYCWMDGWMHANLKFTSIVSPALFSSLPDLQLYASCYWQITSFLISGRSWRSLILNCHNSFLSLSGCCSGPPVSPPGSFSVLSFYLLSFFFFISFELSFLPTNPSAYFFFNSTIF